MEQPTKEKEDMVRLAFLLPKELRRKARIKSVTIDRPISDFLREALEEWVKDEPDPPKQDDTP